MGQQGRSKSGGAQGAKPMYKLVGGVVAAFVVVSLLQKAAVDLSSYLEASAKREAKAARKAKAAGAPVIPLDCSPASVDQLKHALEHVLEFEPGTWKSLAMSSQHGYTEQSVAVLVDAITDLSLGKFKNTWSKGHEPLTPWAKLLQCYGRWRLSPMRASCMHAPPSTPCVLLAVHQRRGRSCSR